MTNAKKGVASLSMAFDVHFSIEVKVLLGFESLNKVNNIV